MKILTRIALANLIVFGLGFYLLSSWIINDLKPEYRKATEEPLVDAARILASVVASSSSPDKVDVNVLEKAFDDVYDQQFSAAIYDYLKRGVDYRVYVTDDAGRVLFHSFDSAMVGTNFMGWRDVGLTLQGQYGARTSQDDPLDESTNVMYVAAPIVVRGKTIGVLTVGKPTRAANLFISQSRQMVRNGSVIVGVFVMIASLILSGMITRPIKKLIIYARAVRDGRRVTLPVLGGSEIARLGEAFEQMRDTLEGKQYVERYVQTLTHEVKSPLAAIRGAVELLKEDMPSEQRERFLANIENESARVQSVAEKLLLLSSLESRKSINKAERLDLAGIVEETVLGIGSQAEKKSLKISFQRNGNTVFEGDRFLVQHAVSNLLMNAVEFSPVGGTIELSVNPGENGSVTLAVCDRGPGVPDYALGRVHERFYSLKRPDTGRKSTGLGLALVREVAELHGGSSHLENRSGGGARAMLSFPTTWN